MEYRNLGRTGARVSAMCLGAMNFGDGADEQESARIVDTFLGAGGNFIDTANVYSRGVSEEFTGKALKANGKRDQVVLATKVHGRMGDGENDWGNTRYHIITQCENSLRRLQTDHIDLYQIHRPQPEIPIDETLRALDDLIRAGKVRYIGTSTFAAWQVVEALWASKEYRLNRFICEQPPYNLFDRRIERELLPMARTYGIGVIPWAPLGGGMLTGKYRKGQEAPAGSRYTNDRFRGAPVEEPVWNLVEGLSALCADKGCSMADFALAWCLSREGVTAPIIGPRTTGQLEENLKAFDVTITEEDNKRVDQLVAPGTFVRSYYDAAFGPDARW